MTTEPEHPTDLDVAPVEMTVRTYLRPGRRAIVVIGLLSLLAAQLEATALVLLVPVAQGISEDRDNFVQEIGPLTIDVSTTAAAAASLGLILGALAITLVGARLRSAFMSGWERRERDRIVADFMAADWEVQSGIRSGRVQSLSNYATRGAALFGAVMTGVRALLSVVIFLGLSFAVDWRSAIFILVVGLGLFAMLRPLSRRVRKMNRTMARELLQYGDDLAEYSSLARDIRIFGAWTWVERRLDSRSTRLEHLRRRSQFFSQAMGPVYQYGGMLVIVIALVMASRSSAVDVASLGAIAILMLRSLNFGTQFQSSWQVILDSTPYLERLEQARAEFIASRPDDGDGVVGRIERLELRGVTYRYSRGTEPGAALDGIDLSFSRGEIVGVVGPSGAGKSTLVQVLLRLRQPSEGDLYVNAEPVRGTSLDSWYRRVTMVPQSNHLFHGTVAENIAFFDETLDRAAVEAAARGASVHDVIESLPEGYETRVGPTFRDLSGGQIQRIGIARALARNPDVIVLDEPTSALDVHSEAAIHDALSGVGTDLLVVIIAHRLSTLSICDRIVVLEDGRVTCDGPPAHVEARNEFFRSAVALGSLATTLPAADPAAEHLPEQPSR